MKKFLFIFSIFIFSIFSNAQSTNYDYNNLWEQVEESEEKRLPRSALAILDSIYKKGKKENNSPQFIKALISKSKFVLRVKEDAYIKIIADFEKEISESKTPTKNILENNLAKIYFKYYKNNRWKINRRTPIETKKNLGDFRTWDLKTFKEKIHFYFQNSLKNKRALQNISFDKFNSTINVEYTLVDSNLSLFDFLAIESLNYYKSPNWHQSNTLQNFSIDSTAYFTDFENLQLGSKDSLSSEFNCLKIYRDLLEFHKKNAIPKNYIITKIDYLNFIKKESTLENKDDLFINALIALQKEYRENIFSTHIDFEIAKAYRNQANRYIPKENEKFRFKNTEALNICKKSMKLFPDSEGAYSCSELIKDIIDKELTVTSEKYIPNETNSRLLIQYKNIDKLYFTLFKINKKEEIELSKKTNDSSNIAYIKGLNNVKKWSYKLRNEKDYQTHTSEIILPKLPFGNYLIFASTEEDFTLTPKTFANSIIRVTNLALIENKNNGLYTYQIVNRVTGSPVKNASVYLNSKYSGQSIDKKFVTNDKGQFSFKSKKHHGNVISTVIYKKDTTIFGDFYLNKYRKRVKDNDDDYVDIKTNILTDRSIYRPGQTIYFKAILAKETNGFSEVFTDEYIEVLLEDSNGNDIQKLDLKLNEFGSVSGEFKIPLGGPTGEYEISIDESYTYDSKFYDDTDFDFDYNSTYISVEEYKRPKFETKFSPVKESFKLNDSIVIKGNATAFSGSKISNAKVNYIVVRTVNFTHWNSNFSQYYPNELKISSGNMLTDKNGDYKIVFKAIPDLKIPKENQPIFNYKIFADVTDLNGETQSTETVVKVGFHTLITSINISSELDKLKKDNSLIVTTNNLNNQFVPTKGIIKIFKLVSPKKPLRKRPWQAPDYQDISKEKFEKLFPNDPYTGNENNKSKWKKGKLVFEKKFDTGISKEISLSNIEKWASGKYIVSIECKDKFNQVIKDEAEFSIFSKTENKVADKQLFYIQKNKNFYKPCETIELKIGSASEDMTVTFEVVKNNKIVKTYLIHLNDEIKTLEIPLQKKDKENFSIKYHYVNYNSFEKGSLPISIFKPEKNIQIETISFRDKLKTGIKETWSFKIKGDKNEKITSEILASMYDASLDKFKNHDWKFYISPSYRNRNYNSSYKNAHYSFGKKTFKTRKLFTDFYKNFKPYSSGVFNGTIKGNIVDEKGEPLIGANITIKGKSVGVVSDFDGNFSIEVKKKETLIFSFIGYATLEIKDLDFSTVKVALIPDESSLDEVVVIGYGSVKKKNVTGAVSQVRASQLTNSGINNLSQLIQGRVPGVNAELIQEIAGAQRITIRGINSTDKNNSPLIVIDGVVSTESFSRLDLTDILSTDILKDASATAIYGSRATNGVILITTKSGQKKIEEELAKVEARTNLKETAFFYPHLTTDKKGTVSFEFTTPEALTRWKLQLLAHTKNLKSSTKTLTATTQKDLMVTPNVPRYLREGDTITISSKIANLTANKLNGLVQLDLTDAITGKDINAKLKNNIKNQNFSIDAKGNTQISWEIYIPKTIQAVQYKVIAKAGDFSDGEQSVLPVLSNRMLVTESIPMCVRSNQTKTFTLDKLKNNTSSTLDNHKLTLEITSNPIWYAVQSLPYLMEYPYECAEQTFARYYANVLANHISISNPKIKNVFDKWANSKALISNLEKNQELKSILISETPWLRDAQSETEQKKRIALLFDLSKMKENLKSITYKLKQMQMSNGGFPWFEGSRYPNRNISQHIATGFGHLHKLGIKDTSKKTDKILKKLITYLDRELLDDYIQIIKRAEELENKDEKANYLKKNHTYASQIYYLYMRTFYKNYKINEEIQKAIEYFRKQSKTYWKSKSLYEKGLIALIHFRNGDTEFANAILVSLKENSILSDEMGMYWKENKASWYWYQSPIETQSLLIETFSEIENDTETIDNLKIWLLKNKQTNQWKTTKATTEAIYALLLQGSDWISVDESIEVKIGNKKIDTEKLKNVQVEAGTGYYKTSWKASEIEPKMATVTLSKKDKGIAWGGLYWQYFENLDKITSSETSLKIRKKLFKKTNGDTGKILTEITSKTTLKVGDLITVRIEIESDRNMEFVHLKDMRAAGFEPINILSEYKWKDGLGYYESTRDASTNFFFDKIPKGIYVFEYDVRINNSGNFSNGISTIQSMYAPEFSSHSEGIRIQIK